MLEDHEHECDWSQAFTRGLMLMPLGLAVQVNPLERSEKRSVRAWSM